jgi:hypothetical protein
MASKRVRIASPFSADGRHILYLARISNSTDQNGIFLTSLDSKESRRLLPDMSNALYAPPLAGSRLAQILVVRNSTLMAQPVNPKTLQLAGDASYVHVRQESQDREMELFEAKSISEAKRWSGFGPVGNAENREIEGSTGKRRESLSDRKIS